MLSTFAAKLYVVTSIAMIGWFAHYTLTGKESGKDSGSGARRRVPAEIRAAPNGLRTFHYWHVGVGGYRGGK